MIFVITIVSLILATAFFLYGISDFALAYIKQDDDPKSARAIYNTAMLWMKLALICVVIAIVTNTISWMIL